jgi:type II secretory pathway pseudopilin PulG
MRWLGKASLRLTRDQKGIGLLESLIAASIVAAVGVTFMGALFTGHRSVGILDEQVQAEILIRSQLEYIKSSDYDESGDYPVSVDLPPQYSMDISVTSPTCIGTADNCVTLEELMGEPITTIQEITVSVSHGNSPVLSVACYKAKQ